MLNTVSTRLAVPNTRLAVLDGSKQSNDYFLGYTSSLGFKFVPKSYEGFRHPEGRRVYVYAEAEYVDFVMTEDGLVYPKGDDTHWGNIWNLSGTWTMLGIFGDSTLWKGWQTEEESYRFDYTLEKTSDSDDYFYKNSSLLGEYSKGTNTLEIVEGGGSLSDLVSNNVMPFYKDGTNYKSGNGTITETGDTWTLDYNGEIYESNKEFGYYKKDGRRVFKFYKGYKIYKIQHDINHEYEY